MPGPISGLSPDTSHLWRKLTQAVPLREQDRSLIDRLPADLRTYNAGEVIILEGDPDQSGLLIQDGWAYRARYLEDGERQIINFLVPGDLTEPGVFVNGHADHSVVALTDVTVATFPHERWFDLLPQSTRLTAALWWYASHEEAVLKEHVVSLGQRGPKSRLYYMMWELWRRLTLVGLADGRSFDMPVDRETLADVIGLSLRHLSRALGDARCDDVLDIGLRRVTIKDEATLLREADCHDTYLQLGAISSKITAAFKRAEAAEAARTSPARIA